MKTFAIILIILNAIGFIANLEILISGKGDTLNVVAIIFCAFAVLMLFLAIYLNRNK
jgi:Na+/melibiose symporter-like transporter